MSNSPETNSELLHRIRDSTDRGAWLEFAQIYQPVIERVARGVGLQDADAANVAQEVLLKIDNAIDTWETGQPPGSFRKWLRTIARNAAVDAIRRAKPDAGHGGTTAQVTLQAVPDRESVVTILKVELERQAFCWAADRIRHEFADATWQAFWRSMVEGQPCEVVAAELGKSVGAIYTSRSRVIRRLKAEVDCFDWDAAEDSEEQK